jgi:hypothetical protein
VLMLKSLRSLTSVFSAMAAGLRGLWITGILPSADNASSNFYRTLSYRSGGFQGLGQ